MGVVFRIADEIRDVPDDSHASERGEVDGRDVGREKAHHSRRDEEDNRAEEGIVLLILTRQGADLLRASADTAGEDAAVLRVTDLTVRRGAVVTPHSTPAQ
jgi:hypothetical protein